MEKNQIIQETTKIIKSRLPADYKVLLFGSWAKGTALPQSDIDIGILGKEKVPFRTYTEIQWAVNTIPTLRSIDVVDLQSVSAHFRNEALQHSREL